MGSVLLCPHKIVCPQERALLSQTNYLPSGLCSMVMRRKFALGIVLHGPKKRIYAPNRAPWSQSKNMALGPCLMVPRRLFASGHASLS